MSKDSWKDGRKGEKRKFWTQDHRGHLRFSTLEREINNTTLVENIKFARLEEDSMEYNIMNIKFYFIFHGALSPAATQPTLALTLLRVT